MELFVSYDQNSRGMNAMCGYVCIHKYIYVYVYICIFMNIYVYMHIYVVKVGFNC
jgi:hypothetical protein